MTIDQLKVLSLGYLTGADILQFAPGQLIINQYERDKDILQRSADLAYSEFIGSLSTRYDIEKELAKTGTARTLVAVRIVSILAIRNILGNLEGVSDTIVDSYTWADNYIKAICNGQKNLIVEQAPENKISGVELVPSAYNHLG